MKRRGCSAKNESGQHMKYHIEKNTVQETLVIPLFGRLVCSERFPELFSDPEAKRICDSLDYDFTEKLQRRGCVSL